MTKTTTQSTTPIYTADRFDKVSRDGRTTTTVHTVRNEHGVVTDTRKSKTMRYVELLITREGKIISASQKVDGTPKPRYAGHGSTRSTYRIRVKDIVNTTPQTREHVVEILKAEKPVSRVKLAKPGVETVKPAPLRESVRKAKAAKLVGGGLKPRSRKTTPKLVSQSLSQSPRQIARRAARAASKGNA